MALTKEDIRKIIREEVPAIVKKALSTRDLDLDKDLAAGIREFEEGQYLGSFSSGEEALRAAQEHVTLHHEEADKV
jgi:hypothetical protein